MTAAGYSAWRQAHRMARAQAVRRLRDRWSGTVLTAGVIGIALALPLCLWLLISETDRFAGSLQQSREIAVFLRLDRDQAAAEAFAARWRLEPRVSAATLRSPAEGLAELRDLGGFESALVGLDQNPLPWVVLIAPGAGVEDRALAQDIAELPEADVVQHDAQWRDRLSAWLALGRRFALVTAALLGLGVLLVVGNTVRLDIQGQSDDILTLRLLGASDAYVRRPFLYLGACYGGFGGVLALLLAYSAGTALAPVVAALTRNYGRDFAWPGLDPLLALLVIALALVLGWLGAGLVVGQHLRQPEGAA